MLPIRLLFVNIFKQLKILTVRIDNRACQTFENYYCNKYVEIRTIKCFILPQKDIGEYFIYKNPGILRK